MGNRIEGSSREMCGCSEEGKRNDSLRSIDGRRLGEGSLDGN